MSSPLRVTSELFRVDEHGHVALPATVRRAAGIDEGAELVARVLGAGQLLLETRDAVRARVWRAAPSSTNLGETDHTSAGERLLEHLGLR